MSVYRCPDTGYYHYGHTPRQVTKGEQQRGEFADKKKFWMALPDDPNEG